MVNSRIARAQHEQKGFTLTELAVVLVIVALLIGGLTLPLSAQYDLRNTSDTQRQLGQIREAIMGFAVVNGYLPCPANVTSNGVEVRKVDGTCNTVSNPATDGLLPWATLGVDRLDSWGRNFRYRVDSHFSSNMTPFSLTTPASDGIVVRTRDSGGNPVALTNANILVAVVLSQGKNGYLAITDGGIMIPNASASNSDEIANASPTGTTYYQRTVNTDASATGGEFDDVVSWIPVASLMNRMVTARKLP